MSTTITPDTTSTTRERIERGAAWLDEVKPGWREIIDTENLRMYSGVSCVLGQVFSVEAYEHDCSNGYGYAFYLANESSAWWAINHGFESGGEAYFHLREAWLDFLAEEV